MSFQNEKGTIRWKTHFNSPPDQVYEALATNEGRATFWAESAIEQDGWIEFQILNYPPYQGKILHADPPKRFALEYFNTQVNFELHNDGQNGTELSLIATNVDESYRMEMAAGWISVLMAMKAAVDFKVDLRNHDPNRSWCNGYADN